MKLIFSTLVVAYLLLTANHSNACSPVPYIFMQRSDISTVLASENFINELTRHFEADTNVSIVKIESQGFIKVTLSNQCEIQGNLEYDPPVSNGLCPRFKGVNIKTVCQ